MSKPNPTLDTLETVLARLEACHAELCESAEAKRAAIVKGDLPALESILERERAIASDIEAEERKRLMTIRIARRGLGLPDQSDGRLADLLDKAAEPQRGRLAAVRDRLKEVLKTLRIRDRANAELLKASLEHVEAFLRTVREASGATTTYNQSGRQQHGGRSLIDRSV